MAKDPAFLFYPSDFLTGTLFMTDEEVGKYIRLLCAQHQQGRLSEKHMLSICKTYTEEVFSKFKKDSTGLYYNERLEQEMQRRSKYTQSRRDNAKGGKKTNVKTKKAYAKHMETVTINENETINKDKAEKKEIVFPFESERFLEMWQHWKNYKDKDHKFKYKSFESEQAALSKLAGIASNEDQAIKIIVQSIENGWKGFFELKTQNGQQNGKNSAKGFAAQYAYDLMNKENKNNGQ